MNVHPKSCYIPNRLVLIIHVCLYLPYIFAEEIKMSLHVFVLLRLA
jgi:hypothetical protein